MKRLLVISGLSGAGKSTALGFFEDAGYFCMDNVPPMLIDSILELVSRSPFPGAVVVVDVRSEAFGDPLEHLKKLRGRMTLIFLEASKEEIIRRYSLTRRSHPLGGVEEGYEEERKKLYGIREMADFIVDTTGMTHKDLREKMRELLEELSRERVAFTFRIKSFSYRIGIPPDSDFVFDARFLPNPYYIPHLSEKTGLDEEVKEFFKNHPEVDAYAEGIANTLMKAKEGYEKEGRLSLQVAIGCSGGRHRSVYIAERVAKILKGMGERVVVEHRELGVRA